MKKLLRLTALLSIAALPELLAQSLPSAFDMSGGATFTFTSWNSTATSGTYPDNMFFRAVNIASGGGNDVTSVSTEPSNDWDCTYSLTSRARFNGVGASGIQMTNTSDGQNAACSGNGGQTGKRPLDVIVGLNTTNRQNISVSWTGRTVTASDNNRVYSITLQYQIGVNPWTDVVTYTSGANGSSSNFSNILPVECSNQSTVYLRWVYYQSSGSSGTRPTMQLDEISISSTVLPISLLRFDAVKSGKQVFVSFATAQERNNSHFNLERSTDGRTFATLETIAGAGNSDEVKNYRYTDNNPLPGTNYYRLKQVDFDGKYTFSPVRSVLMDAASGLKLFPQPAAETLNMELEKAFAEDATWQILDMSGRMLAQGVLAAEQQQFELPVAALTQGTYVLRLVAGQTLLTRQFRKQ